jgi:hypothetical protein
MGIFQARQFHSVCFHLLLIATAIQGVTPDAQDIASLNALRLLCPALAGSNALASDDGLPDEVCGLNTWEMELVLRARGDSDEQTSHTFFCSDKNGQTTRSSALLPVIRGGNPADANDLIHSLCRLNC